MLIRSLVEVASRGGNFLLNVGPQPDGVIQPEFQERLPTIGSWLSVNGESIYGTTYGPLQGVLSIRTTVKKDKSLFACLTGRVDRLRSTVFKSECFQLIWCRRTTR
jgi:alpha-L-fucosidase